MMTAKTRNFGGRAIFVVLEIAFRLNAMDVATPLQLGSLFAIKAVDHRPAL
jgi:hypothetical protein